MSNHKNVADDEEFTTIMNNSGSQLIVVDFNATWCGPCVKIAPVFIQLAHKFPEALFLGVSFTLIRMQPQPKSIIGCVTGGCRSV